MGRVSIDSEPTETLLFFTSVIALQGQGPGLWPEKAFEWDEQKTPLVRSSPGAPSSRKE